MFFLNIIKIRSNNNKKKFKVIYLKSKKFNKIYNKI